VIARLKAYFPVTYLCEKLGVSTSGFYDWAVNKETANGRRHDELTVLVVKAFAESQSSAGHRKIAAMLRGDGHHVNRKTVAGIMTELGLMPEATKKAFKRAKFRAARGKDPADLLDRCFTSLSPGSIVVSDITYVHTREGWLYVATMIDLASRAVIGHASGSRQTASLVIQALKAAKSSGLLRPGTILHSDHGSQYRAKQLIRHCSRNGLRRSMGGRMECWDNACAETFFSKLKAERLDQITFATRRAATREVDDYINYFNTRRPHQTLGQKTPASKIAELTEA